MLEGRIDRFGSGDMTFAAYVASSTQHEELNANDVVNGDELCGDLQKRGFKVGLSSFMQDVLCF